MITCPKCGTKIPATAQARGGRKRARNMTAAQRREAARRAAQARWGRLVKKSKKMFDTPPR